MDGITIYLLDFISNYQYLALFLLLSLGMIGLPVPDEFLMMYSGFQVSLGRMSFGYTVFIACLGSFMGMNLTYWIGRKLRNSFLRKLGKYFIPKEGRVVKVESWFQRFGNPLFILGYFLPGFRQLISYFAGMKRLNYRRYLCLIGLGSIVWTMTFVALGFSLGLYWQEAMFTIHSYLIWGAILFGVTIISGYLVFFKTENSEIL